MTPLDDPAALAGKIDGTGSRRRGRQHRAGLAARARLQAERHKLSQISRKALRRRRQALRRRIAADLRRCGRPTGRCAARLVARCRAAQRRAVGPGARMPPPRASPSCTPGSIPQTEGWWRYAFDTAGVPYDYISTQTVAKEADLRSKYDVIIFAPVGGSSAQRHH